MSNDESDLERLLADGVEEIRTALDGVEDDELPDEEAESVRETADAAAEAVADASFDELLAATGFGDTSDDVAPADLPRLMQDADADAVLGLRRLLELADLSEEWSDLDAGERIDRLERIDGDASSGGGDRSVSDLLSTVFSTRDSGEEAATDEASEEADGERDGEESDANGDEVESEDGEEDAASATEGTLAELRSLFDAAGLGDDADDEAADATEETEDEPVDVGGRGERERVTTKVSTVPSSRSDVGRTARPSTMPKKKK
ncbi:hypothetical protein [Haladaptatus salinisoli]|uniref:hypothetical protein n=1 Tax=Haladaptatus salinisoli TaxID=2884876 RepID=UPI001D0A818F|nr:hypothetical protein [Haladaptatus salinisoli]